jgi:pyrroloquinoline-quinone synthase
VSDWVPARVPPEAFVRTLWAEVERHPAVAHPFLCRFAEGGLARWQIGDYTSQYYQLVGSFTAYLEAMRGGRPIRRSAACCAASSRTSTCPQAFEHSHPALYRRFMRAVGFEEGAWDRVPVLPETRAFIVGHLDMTLRSWLEALGAVGPGHEWAIPRMFPISCGGSSGAWRFLRRRWSISASTSTSTWSMAGRWRGCAFHLLHPPR